MLPLALGGPAHPGEHIWQDTFTWGGSWCCHWYLVTLQAPGNTFSMTLLPGVAPGAAIDTWWPCPPQRTHLTRYFYLGWLLVLPLVLGGPARSGELLQKVAQRRVGQTQHLLALIQHKKYKNNKGKK